MVRSCSLFASPASHRRLHRSIDAGIGCCARHVPFEYSKKSPHGAAFISRSATSILFSLFVWPKPVVAQVIATQKVRNRRIIVLATRPDRAFFRSQPTERLAEPSPAFPEL